MSIFVVVNHMDGGGRIVSDFVNLHTLQLAVPTFIFISIYLYASKPVSITAFKKHFARLFILLSFWPIAYLLYSHGYKGLLWLVPTSPMNFVHMVLRGGYTIFWFFPSLIICLFIAHLFLQLNRKFQLSIFFISVVLLAFLPLFTMLTGFWPLSAYWSPLNFIPLSLAAALLAQNKDKILKNSKIVLLLSVVLCVCFSIFEWKYYSVGQVFFSSTRFEIPAYTRTSLMFAVIFVFVLALNPRIKANSVIKYMSRYSLALYCLHGFLQRPVTTFVTICVQNETVALYISIMLVVVFSYPIAMLLRKFPLGEKIIV